MEYVENGQDTWKLNIREVIEMFCVSWSDLVDYISFLHRVIMNSLLNCVQTLGCCLVSPIFV